MEGPQRLSGEQIGQPDDKNPLVELRFTNLDGETEVWLLPRGAVWFSEIRRLGQIRMAYLDKGVDSRLATQNAAIERLKRHVDKHHTELNRVPFGIWDCNWDGNGDSRSS